MINTLVFIDGADFAGKTELAKFCGDIFLTVNSEKEHYDMSHPISNGCYKSEKYNADNLLDTAKSFFYPVKYNKESDTTRALNFTQGESYTFSGDFSSEKYRDFLKHPKGYQNLLQKTEKIDAKDFIFDRGIISVLGYYIMEREVIENAEASSIHPKFLLKTFLRSLSKNAKKLVFGELKISEETLIGRIGSREQLSEHDKRMRDNENYRKRYFDSMQKAYDYLEEILESDEGLRKKVSLGIIDNNTDNKEGWKKTAKQELMKIIRD